MENHNNNDIDLLDKALKSYGRSLSEFDSRIIQFVIENVDSNTFQWFAKQVCCFEELTHSSITIETIKKIISYKEADMNNTMVPKLGEQHTVFGSTLFHTATRTIWSNYNHLHAFFYIGDKQIIDFIW